MEAERSLLLDVSIALAVALVGGWLAARLRLSPIVGYIAAGVVISPFTPGFVGDVERLRLIADIGVVLLLFSVGVQFKLGHLLLAGPRVILAASAQIGFVMLAAWAVGTAAGWSRDEALYVGAAAAITSSVVLVKILEARQETTSAHGTIAIAWSVVQDLWGVVLIAVLAAVVSEGGGASATRDVSLAALKAAAFVVGILVLGLRIVPPILARIAEDQSRELFFVAIAALALGTALASEYVGLSLALGAFLAGLLVSESEVSHRALDDLLPARDVFAVLFFVAVGMLIDPDVVRTEWPTILIVSAIVIGLRCVLTWLLLVGASNRETVFLATAALVPTGEFAFLLANAGVNEGALSQETFGAVIAVTAISILLAPALMAAAHALLSFDPLTPSKP